MAYCFSLVSILCPFLNLYISKMNINLINSRGQLHGPQRSMTAQTIDGQRDFIRAISNKKLRNMLVEQDQRARIGGNLGVCIKLWFITAISLVCCGMTHTVSYRTSWMRKKFDQKQYLGTVLWRLPSGTWLLMTCFGEY